MASSCSDAIRKETRFAVDEVWLDDDWRKDHPEMSSVRKIGFDTTQ